MIITNNGISVKSMESIKKIEFTEKDFERICKLIYQYAGISLGCNKKEMVFNRLNRRLRVIGVKSFSEYLDLLERDNKNEEWQEFINALTTNLTSFFRENHHFEYLIKYVKNKKDPIEIWCAASSTGEEPYSIAMTLCEAFNTLTPPAKIIATDIDTNVLKAAASGVYSADKVEKMSQSQIKKFFQKGKGANDGMVRVRPELQKMISFQQINLLSDNWPFKRQFDAIFCRNVMIYFDKPTQSKIIYKFIPLMKDDALLFMGHSENFSHVSNKIKLLGRAIYEKV